MNLHVRPPPVKDRQSKTPKLFPVRQNLTVRSSNDHLLYANATLFLRLTVWFLGEQNGGSVVTEDPKGGIAESFGRINDFPMFLTTCKRPLDASSDLSVRCVHHATKSIRRPLVTTWNYSCRNLIDTACNKSSTIKLMCPDLFSEEAPMVRFL